jgi:hypothetical protein
MTTPSAIKSSAPDRVAIRADGALTVSQGLSLLPLLFVLLIFLGYFAVLLVYGRGLLKFPFDYDQGEGFELYDAIRLARGQSIYLDNAVFPFYSSNYPPVFRLMMVPLIWLFGPQIWVGRIVSLAATMGIGLFIFLVARRQYPKQFEAQHWFSLSRILSLSLPLLAALAFFAANYVYEIAPLARAHLPMVMFAFAGIYFIGHALEEEGSTRPRAWLVGIGVALLIVAGFTKLQAIDALAAGFAYLLLRKPKWCAIALAASTVAVAIVVVLLNAATGGQFWLNVVLANVNEYDIQRTWMFYGQWFQLQGVLIVCAALYVIWDLVRMIRARSLRPLTIWSLYFLAGSAMGMLTGKWGAGPTYLIAAIAASCVCTVGLLYRVAAVLKRVAEIRRWHDPLGVSMAVLAVLSAGVFFYQATLNVHLPTSGRLLGSVARLLGVEGRSSYAPYQYYDSIGYTQLGHLLDIADTINGFEMVKIIQSAKGPVWSEEAMLTLTAGKDVVTNPTQLLNLSKSNMLDTMKMIDMIRSKAFGAVIFRAQFYPQDVMIAFGQNYHWATTVRMNGFDYMVLMPNDQ